MLRKRLFGMMTLLVGVMLVFAFIGCDNGNKDNENDGPFTVKFVANGGTPAPSDKTIEKGETVTQPPEMTNSNHEDFNGWYTNSACTVPFNFSTLVNSDLTLYAKWGYFVGDTGPAGGKIFYIKSGSNYPNWKYLEASPAELPNQKMVTGYYDSGASTGASYYVVEAAKQTAIGTGQANTNAFLAIEAFPPFNGDDIPQTPAARSTDNFSAGGYSNWFLPSKDELQALLDSNVLNITNDTHYYWSSSQHPDGGRIDCVWALDFGTGDRGLWNEENKEHDRAFVRPIRSFFCSH
jgi:uncharacterized repeat protein (TIGR02543 family)